MEKRHILTAALLGIGGIGLIVLPASAQDQANQPAAGATAQPSAAQPSAAQPSAGQSSSTDLSGSAKTAGAAAAAAVSQSDARQVLSQTAQNVLTKGNLQNLNQQLCQGDQQRVGDLSKDAQQVDQAVDQIRQAYKDKYQKDLDLSQNADQIFTVEFFQIGGAGAQARQASDRQGPSASADQGAAGSSGAAAGTAGSSSASGAGTPGASPSAAGGASASPSAAGTSGTSVSGDVAQTAGSTTGKATYIVIPASHGMQEARVALVNEGGQWKINLPDSVDGKQLTQKIQQQLQQCAQSKDQWPADATQAQQAIAHSILIAFADPNAPGASSATGGAGTGSAAGGTSGTSSGTNR